MVRSRWKNSYLASSLLFSFIFKKMKNAIAIRKKKHDTHLRTHLKIPKYILHHRNKYISRTKSIHKYVAPEQSMNIRSSCILPFFDKKGIQFYNGVTKRILFIKPNMFGYKFGSFFETKKICVYRRKKNRNKKKKK